jgi:uncharacterized cupin superfamily protein
VPTFHQNGLARKNRKPRKTFANPLSKDLSRRSECDNERVSAATGGEEMPKIDIAKIPAQQMSNYPKEFAHVIAGRERQRLGDAAGLSQFGVNLTRIKPGSASSLRHWHEQEDEFIFMLQGELVLKENDGETVLRPGDAAGFKANSGIGHCLINRGSSDAVYLEIGTRSANERVQYSDVDLMLERDGSSRRFLRKSGAPIRE